MILYSGVGSQIEISSGLTLFVSPTGSDSNPGTSALPLATISKALALGATSIRVEAGSYSDTVLMDGLSGVEIICEGQAVITYVTNAKRSVIWMKDCHNVYIEGIKATGGDLSSWSVDECNNILLVRCEASNSVQSMGFGVNNSDAEFHFCKADNNKWDGFNQHGTGFCQYFDCSASGNEDDGYSNHDTTQAVFVRCLAVGNRTGIVPVHGTEVYIDSCVAAANSNHGIVYNGTAVKTVRITNNLSYDNGGNDYQIDTSGNVVAYNNRNKTGIAFENFPTFAGE